MDPILQMHKAVKEATKVSFTITKGTFQDIKNVVKTLSKRELKFIAPGHDWVDSPYNECRYVARVGKDIAGFIDGYCFPDDKEHIIVVIAVKPQYRGTGIASALTEEIIDYARKTNRVLFIRIDKSNIASQRRFAEFNPKLLRDNGDQYVYEIRVND